MNQTPESESPAPERAGRIAECIGLVGGELMDEPRAAEAMAGYERLRKRYDEALEALRRIAHECDSGEHTEIAESVLARAEGGSDGE